MLNRIISCLYFLRRSLIFIIKGFQTIVFIFIVISTTFSDDISSGLLQLFVEHRNLDETSNYVRYWIHASRLFWFR